MLDFTREFLVMFQPFLVFVNVILGIVISATTLYLLIRTRPGNVKSQMPSAGTVVINWSGHPLPETPWLTPFKVWEPLQAPQFDVTSWETLQDSVKKMMRGLPKDLQMRLLRGGYDVVVVVPQLAAGLTILLATLHGKMGVFPTITCPLRKSDGSFWLPDPISLGEVRLRSREERETEE